MHSPCPVLTLKKNRDHAVRKGHPWIFSGAVADPKPDIEPGAVVRVCSNEKEVLGLGFCNPGSDIFVRMLTRMADRPIDRTFWENRIQLALEMRQRCVPPETNAYRLINAEGDGLPGLIADQYQRTLVVSFQTAGMDLLRESIVNILKEIASPEAVYERSESRSRRREGLPDRVGWIQAPRTEMPVPILENGLQFEVDMVSGQKTGFFLDQRPNRQRIRKLSRGLHVLNCFSYTGAFSVYSVSGGARRVTSVETSKTANEMAGRNYHLNATSPDKHPIIGGDVFDYLKQPDQVFDLIILDPPAFAKSHKDVKRAFRAYVEINRLAMLCLRPGGYLMTFSCSNPVTGDLFHKMILNAAEKAGKSVQQVESLGPGPDHPVLLVHREGHYLTGLLLRISD